MYLSENVSVWTSDGTEHEFKKNRKKTNMSEMHLVTEGHAYTLFGPEHQGCRDPIEIKGIFLTICTTPFFKLPFYRPNHTPKLTKFCGLLGSVGFMHVCQKRLFLVPFTKCILNETMATQLASVSDD